MQQDRKSLAERIVRLGRLAGRYEIASSGALGVGAGIALVITLVLK